MFTVFCWLGVGDVCRIVADLLCYGCGFVDWIVPEWVGVRLCLV